MSSYPPYPPSGPNDPSGPSGTPGQYGPPGQYPGQYGAGQQYPGQYPGQQYPGQQYPGQQAGGQQYPGQYGAQPYPDQYPGQPHPGAPQSQYGGYPQPGGVGQGADPLVSQSLGEWFSRNVEVVKRSWKSLVVIQLVSSVLVAIVAVVVLLVAGASALVSLDPTALAQSLGSVFGAIIVAGLLIAVVSVVVYAIALGMSTYVVVRDATGRPASLAEAFAFARSRALPMIGWGLAVALGVGLVIAVIVGIAAAIGSTAIFFLVGLVLLVAYVYLAVVLVPTFTGVVALERQGIGRMFALAHRDLAGTAGRVLLFLLIAFVYNLVMSSIIDAVAGNSPTVSGLLSAVLVSLPLGLAGTAVSIVTYAGLRHHENPAVSTHTLAAEMAR
jgi:hypothetical protein